MRPDRVFSTEIYGPRVPKLFALGGQIQVEKQRFRNFIVQPEKMRFIEYLLYLLGKKLKETERPLIEIVCEMRIKIFLKTIYEANAI